MATSLSYLATARQAQVDPVVLEVYCNELKGFPIDEVCTAVKNLARTPRREGETAMPDVGTIVEAVRYVGRFRIAEEARKKQIEAEKHLREHPEDYVPVRDIFADVMEKKKDKFADLRPTPLPAASAEPLPPRCPSCGGVLPWEGTLSTLNARDLRILADSIDRRKQQTVTA